MDKRPPSYSEGPDGDPFEDNDDDPNLSSVAPPNPANMRPPTEESRRWIWHVLTGSPAVGMSPSW